MNPSLGELAAFGTALCWSASAIFFTRAANRTGGVTMNHARVALAIPMMALLHLLVRGEVFPGGVESYRWGWLALSGVIGLALGDSFLFSAFVHIGPRLALLIMSLVPIFSTTAAWVFLGERLVAREIAGVALAVGGIAWVVLERRGDPNGPARRRYGPGIGMAVCGALGQALGLVAAKKGMAGGFPAISATLIRMVAAAGAMWAVAALRRDAVRITRAAADPRALRPLLVAVFLGSAVGIWLSLVSVQYARLGIASTLMALTPVLILPLAHWQLGEKITLRAVLGTAVTFGGVAVLLL